MRFSKPYMRDYRVGGIKNPDIPVADVVAASAAFPPFLSPAVLRFNPEQFTLSGTDLEDESYRRKMILTDGGVYDDLGLESAWKRYETVLISNAETETPTKSKPSLLWSLQAYRALTLTQTQVGNIRKQQSIHSLH